MGELAFHGGYVEELSSRSNHSGPLFRNRGCYARHIDTCITCIA
jgi:hypothetical protein